MIQKAWELKLVRFVSVGLVNTSLDFLLLNIFVFAFHLPVLVANLMSVCIGISISYLLNHHIVFRNKTPITIHAYFKFFLITGTSVLLIQTLTIYLASPVINHAVNVAIGAMGGPGLLNIKLHENVIALNLVKALAVLVGMVWNYVLYSKIVFANKVSTDFIDS